MSTTLPEWMGAADYWMTPDAKLERVHDHLEWALENMDFSGLGLTGNGDYPTVQEVFDGETSFDLGDFYSEAARMGFLRVVVSNGVCYYCGNAKPKQLRELRDWCIEHDYRLQRDASDHRITEMTTCAAVPASTSAPMQITFNSTSKPNSKKRKRTKRELPPGKSLIDSILRRGASIVVELQAQ